MEKTLIKLMFDFLRKKSKGRVSYVPQMGLPGAMGNIYYCFNNKLYCNKFSLLLGTPYPQPVFLRPTIY